MQERLRARRVRPADGGQRCAAAGVRRGVHRDNGLGVRGARGRGARQRAAGVRHAAAAHLVPGTYRARPPPAPGRRGRHVGRSRRAPHVPGPVRQHAVARLHHGAAPVLRVVRARARPATVRRAGPGQTVHSVQQRALHYRRAEADAAERDTGGRYPPQPAESHSPSERIFQIFTKILVQNNFMTITLKYEILIFKIIGSTI